MEPVSQFVLRLMRGFGIIAAFDLAVGVIGTLVLRAGVFGFLNITFFAAIGATVLAMLQIVSRGPLAYNVLGGRFSTSNLEQDLYTRQSILADDRNALRRESALASRAVPLVTFAVGGGIAAVLIAEAIAAFAG